MIEMTAALRGLRWQYATGRIGLAALERAERVAAMYRGELTLFQ
jgi:hypothetical protein